MFFYILRNLHLFGNQVRNIFIVLRQVVLHRVENMYKCYEKHFVTITVCINGGGITFTFV